VFLPVAKDFIFYYTLGVYWQQNNFLANKAIICHEPKLQTAESLPSLQL